MYTVNLKWEELRSRLAPYEWDVSKKVLGRRRQYFVFGENVKDHNPFTRLWKRWRYSEDSFWVSVDGFRQHQQFTYRSDLDPDIIAIVNEYLLPYTDPRRLPDNILTLIQTHSWVRAKPDA